MMDDKVWSDFINGLEIMGELPNEEPIEQVPEEEEETSDSKLLRSDAAIVRLRMDVYLITPIEDKKAYMVNGNQVMEDMGVMTVKEILQIIKSRKKKNL